jgi:L-asparagine transporter-like permease
MKDWAEALIAAVLIVGVVLWSVRVFIEAIYGR